MSERTRHEFPAELTEPLREVLSLMVWQSGSLAREFRFAGHEVPQRAEDEQAFVLHWLIGLALEHGRDWRVMATRQLERMRAEELARRKEETENEET